MVCVSWINYSLSHQKERVIYVGKKTFKGVIEVSLRTGLALTLGPCLALTLGPGSALTLGNRLTLGP